MSEDQVTIGREFVDYDRTRMAWFVYRNISQIESKRVRGPFPTKEDAEHSAPIGVTES